LIITWLFSAGRQTHAGRVFFLSVGSLFFAVLVRKPLEAFIIHFSTFHFSLLPFAYYLLPFTFSFLLNNRLNDPSPFTIPRFRAGKSLMASPGGTFINMNVSLFCL